MTYGPDGSPNGVRHDAFFAVGQLRHVVQAAAADDANRRVAHEVRDRSVRLPRCPVMNAAGMAGSCSKNTSVSRAAASSENACLAASVSIG